MLQFGALGLAILLGDYYGAWIDNNSILFNIQQVQLVEENRFVNHTTGCNRERGLAWFCTTRDLTENNILAVDERTRAP